MSFWFVVCLQLFIILCVFASALQLPYFTQLILQFCYILSHLFSSSSAVPAMPELKVLAAILKT